MNVIRHLLRKEFLQIFRNKAMLPILFILPVVQLMILSFAATFELKQAQFALVDMDQTQFSREIVQRFQATGYFSLEYATSDMDQAIEQMDRGNVKMILHIPHRFQRNLANGQMVPIQLVIDAVDGNTAGLIQSYGSAIIEDFSRDKTANLQFLSDERSSMVPKSINLIPHYWYNPDLDYINYMVPGILVVLVSMIGLFLSGMNIVREHEIGTIEQLNVTPIKRYQLIIGKLLPFWIIGMVDLLIGLALARFFFQIPFLGSLALILAVAGLFLVVVQSIGLFISTVTNTQQQAMFIAWFIMVVFILIGGLFTPIESMPGWAQDLTLANPVAWFIDIMRSVLLKGAGWQEIQTAVAVLAAMGVLFLFIAITRYRKTTA